MTKIVYKKTNSFFKSISVSGHSNFASKGRDIVCAGISAIVEGSYSFLSSYYSELILIESKGSKVIFTPLKNDPEVNICLEMMFYQLKNVEHAYPDYLTFVSEK